MPALKVHKNKRLAYILLIFLGSLGFHKFYLKQVKMAVFYLLTFGGFLIGVWIDLFTLGKRVDKYNQGLASP